MLEKRVPLLALCVSVVLAQTLAPEPAVFPEAARGLGEGPYGSDLEPGSTMTNATVADLGAAPQGRTLKLKSGDGE